MKKAIKTIQVDFIEMDEDRVLVKFANGDEQVISKKEFLEQYVEQAE